VSLLLPACWLGHDADVVKVEVVQLLRLPGKHTALVSSETAKLGAAMGELRRIEHEARAESGVSAGQRGGTSRTGL
jgi:hypothetical protein